MKTKKHLRMLLACGITAVLAVLYIRVAKQGNLYIDWSIMLQALGLTAGLFAFAELAQALALISGDMKDEAGLYDIKVNIVSEA